MTDILQKIIEVKQQEVARNDCSALRMAAQEELRTTYSMSHALRSSATGIIAEFKRKSPSKGWINASIDVEQVVDGYRRAGAAACSVLTDTSFFGGSPEDLLRARSVAGSMPLLRKDFIIDASQIYQARLSGADAVLLIAACLTHSQCYDLAALAHTLGMEVLLEVHTEDELDRLNSCVDMLGVNNRNLGSFVTDVQNSFRLAHTMHAFEDKAVLVSESGISDATVIQALRSVGFRGFLMGEAFMRHNDPAQALSNLILSL